MWFKKDLTLDALNDWNKNTMSEFLGIQFTEMGDDFLRGTMPVTNKTRQPYGILHGGASIALAETLGSVASALIIDREKMMCVGLEINANHIKSMKEGLLTAIARPIHIGRSTHVWEIRMTNEAGQLICISRHTVAILEKRN